MKAARITRVVPGLLAVALLAAACSSGSSEDASSSAAEGTTAASEAAAGPAAEELIMWTAEDNADRVKAMEGIAAAYTAETGTAIKIVPVAEDQMASQVAAAAAADDLPDLFSAVSLGTVHSFATDGITSPSAATNVINTLGPDTFSPKALEACQGRRRVHLGPE